MKILKLKSILFSLTAIALITAFLSSCEEDLINKSPSIEEQVDHSSIPEGNLKTELNLSIDSKSRAVISVSTNNNEIFAQLIHNNFKAELITLNMEDSRENDVEDINRIDEDFDESLLNTDEYFFSMKILEEYTNEGDVILYTFGEELLATLEKYKAQTHIQISSQKDNAINDRYDVDRGYVLVYGDGDHDGKRTKLRMRYDYNCGGRVFYKETSIGFYTDYEFNSCVWPYSRSDRNRYTSFSVIQDQAQSFHRGDSPICYGC